jgi:chromosome segregation ATPase
MEKDAEKTALQGLMEALRTEIAHVRDARDSADARAVRAELSSVAKDEELAALREEVAGFAASLDRKDSVYAAVLQSNSTLRAEVDALTAALEITKSQSRERSGKAVARIKQLTSELEGAREELNLARMATEDSAVRELSAEQECERLAKEASYEADRRAMSEKSDYLTNKISEMAELEIKLREKVRSLKAQRAETLAATAQLTRDLEEARDAHNAAVAAHAGELASYDAQVSGLVAQMSSLEVELSAAKLQVSEIGKSLEEREFLASPAAHFTVLLRCSDGNRNWCLTRYCAKAGFPLRYANFSPWIQARQLVREWIGRPETGMVHGGPVCSGAGVSVAGQRARQRGFQCRVLYWYARAHCELIA